MNRKLLMFALLASIAVAACKPKAPEETAAPAAEPTAEAPAEQPAPTAVESAPATSAAEVPFDVKAFAGTFSGTLPCADCPAMDTRITLNADGSYKLRETYQGKAGNGFNGDGTWTAEENGKRIRLDPNSKSEQDRLFAVISKDQIDVLDLEGKAIDSKTPHSLKREGATQ